MLYIADKKTKTPIVRCRNFAEGAQIIKDFEFEDKNNGVYTENYYVIINVKSTK